MFEAMNIGDRFGKLLVLSEVFTRKDHRVVVCKCEMEGCTTVKLFRVNRLERGTAKRCAGHRAETATKHGGAYTSLHARWRQLIQRCHSPSHPHYVNYGARGISVCDRWRASFADFRADVGDPPEGMELDRRNNNGNYEPGNIRWATRTTQSMNRRSTKLEPHEPSQIRWLVGDGYTKAEVARFFDVSEWLITGIVRGKTHKKEAAV